MCDRLRGVEPTTGHFEVDGAPLDFDQVWLAETDFKSCVQELDMVAAYKTSSLGI